MQSKPPKFKRLIERQANPMNQAPTMSYSSAPAEAQLESATHTSRPPHVLAVDDDPSMLATIRRVLRRSKIDVTPMKCGIEALKQLGPSLPDLVLLDVSMPSLSGHSFLRRFRHRESVIRRITGWIHPPTPVIFLTAQSGSRQRIDGLNAGAVDYILKPFDPEELRARVRTHLRNARHIQQILPYPHPQDQTQQLLSDNLSGAAV